MNAFFLFVYGTLKRGQRAHLPLCAAASFVGNASVRGKLHLHRAGYPVLVVPDDDVLAEATSDPAADAALHDAPPARGVVSTVNPPGEWRWIRGEVLSFSIPYSTIAAIDVYEGTKESAEPSTYRRVLLPLEDARVRQAWAFAATPRVGFATLSPFEADWWP